MLCCDYIHVFKYLTSKSRSCITKIMWVLIQICFKQFNQMIASCPMMCTWTTSFFSTKHSFNGGGSSLVLVCQIWVKKLLFQMLVCDQCDDKIKWSLKHEIVCWSIFIMFKFFVLGFWFLISLLQLMDVGDCPAYQGCLIHLKTQQKKVNMKLNVFERLSQLLLSDIKNW